MRNIPQNIFLAMQRDNIVSFLAVKIGPAEEGTVLAYTSLPFDITYEAVTYSANNGLMQVDPPKLSEIMDRDTYKLVIADPNYTLRAIIDAESFTGASVSVYAGLLDPQGELEDNLLLIYKGFLDGAEYDINPSGEITITLDCSSPMGAFDLTRTLLTSQNYLRNKYKGVYPSDNSYDQVLIGSDSVTLLWGKKEKNR